MKLIANTSDGKRNLHSDNEHNHNIRKLTSNIHITTIIPPTSGRGGLDQAPPNTKRLSKHNTINIRDAREASGSIPRSMPGAFPEHARSISGAGAGEVIASWEASKH